MLLSGVKERGKCIILPDFIRNLERKKLHINWKLESDLHSTNEAKENSRGGCRDCFSLPCLWLRRVPAMRVPFHEYRPETTCIKETIQASPLKTSCGCLRGRLTTTTKTNKNGRTSNPLTLRNALINVWAALWSNPERLTGLGAPTTHLSATLHALADCQSAQLGNATTTNASGYWPRRSRTGPGGSGGRCPGAGRRWPGRCSCGWPGATRGRPSARTRWRRTRTCPACSSWPSRRCTSHAWRCCPL